MKTSTFIQLLTHYMGAVFLLATVPLLSVEAQSCPFTVEVETTPPSSCTSSQGSQACITVKGGTPPYHAIAYKSGMHYALGDLAENDKLCSHDLPVGEYQLNIRDVNDCLVIDTFTIVSNPQPLQVEVIPTAPSSCNSMNGSICLAVTGGVPPYQISQLQSEIFNRVTSTKSNINPEESICWDNIVAGIHTFRIKDSRGCTTTQSISLTHETKPIQVDIHSEHHDTQTKEDDELCVHITGGVAPYQVYIVKTEHIYNKVSILNQDAPEIMEEGIEKCFTNIPAPHDTQPPNNNPFHIDYYWFETRPARKLYTSSLLIVDSEGCAFESGDVRINHYSPPTTTTHNTPPSTTETLEVSFTTISRPNCINSLEQMCLDIAGGVPPFTIKPYFIVYVLNYNDPDDRSNFSFFTVFDYEPHVIDEHSFCLDTVTYDTWEVVDANGLTNRIRFNVDHAFEQLTVTTNLISPSHCTAQNGELCLTVTSGHPPYSILKGDSIIGELLVQEDSFCLSNLSIEERVNLTVIDRLGCSQHINKRMPTPESTIVIEATTTPNPPCSEQKGGWCAVISGGQAPYMLTVGDEVWEDIAEEEKVCLENSSSNQPLLKVTDANGCITKEWIYIPEGEYPIQLNLTKTDADCGENNGNMCFSLTGGVPPYKLVYKNNFNPFLPEATIPQVDSSASIDSTDDLSAAKMNTANESKPKTASGTSNDLYKSTLYVEYPPYILNNIQEGEMLCFDSLKANNYRFQFTDANGCTVQKDITIGKKISDITVDIVVHPTSQCNSENGSVCLTISGGSGIYDVKLNNQLGLFIEDISRCYENLSGGTHQINITDQSGCTHQTTVFIPQSDNGDFTATATPTDAACNNNSGSVCLSITGGAPPYEVSDANNNFGTFPSDSCINNLLAGDYEFVITDTNGCSIQLETTVNSSGDGNIPQFEILEPFCENGTTLVHVYMNGADTTGVYYVYFEGTDEPLLVTYGNVFTLPTLQFSVEDTATHCFNFSHETLENVCEDPCLPTPGAPPAEIFKTICASDSLNLIDCAEAGGGNLWYDELTGDTLTNPLIYVEAAEDCGDIQERIFYYLVESGLPPECNQPYNWSDVLHLTIIPPADPEISVQGCVVRVDDYCPDYMVYWQTPDGNRGEGTEYIAQENTSGEVTFTFEVPNFHGIDPNGCGEQDFTVSFQCEEDTICDLDAGDIELVGTDVECESEIFIVTDAVVPPNTAYAFLIVDDMDHIVWWSYGNQFSTQYLPAGSYCLYGLLHKNNFVLLDSTFTALQNSEECFDLTDCVPFVVPIIDPIESPKIAITQDPTCVDEQLFTFEFSVNGDQQPIYEVYIESLLDGERYDIPVENGVPTPFELPSGEYEIKVLNPDTGCPYPDTYTFSEYCDSIPCPDFPDINPFHFLTICGGDTINLNELTGIVADSVLWFNEQTGEFVDDPTQIALTVSGEECEVSYYSFFAEYTIPFPPECGGDILGFAMVDIAVLPDFAASIDAEECIVRVDHCDFLLAEWEDTFGNEGTGNTYFAAPNTSGSVTFTIFDPTDFADCGEPITLSANFDCPEGACLADAGELFSYDIDSSGCLNLFLFIDLPVLDEDSSAIDPAIADIFHLFIQTTAEIPSHFTYTYFVVDADGEIVLQTEEPFITLADNEQMPAGQYCIYGVLLSPDVTITPTFAPVTNFEEWLTLLNGCWDVSECLPLLKPNTSQCTVTSPPICVDDHHFNVGITINGSAESYGIWGEGIPDTVAIAGEELVLTLASGSYWFGVEDVVTGCRNEDILMPIEHYCPEDTMTPPNPCDWSILQNPYLVESCSGEPFSLMEPLLTDLPDSLMGNLPIDLLLPFLQSFPWFNDAGEVVADPNAVMVTTEDCEIQEITYHTLIDLGDLALLIGLPCAEPIEIRVQATIFPEIDAHIEAGVCGASLHTDCDNIAATWTDSFGNTGEGLVYHAEIGTSGEVTFTYYHHPQSFHIDSFSCGENMMSIDFSCPDDACLADAGTISVPQDSLILCGGETFNVIDISNSSTSPDVYHYQYFFVDAEGNIIELISAVTDEFTPRRFFFQDELAFFSFIEGEYCLHGISYDPRTVQLQDGITTLDELQALNSCLDISDCLPLTGAFPPEYDLVEEPVCNHDGTFSVTISVFGGSGLYINAGIPEPFEVDANGQAVLTFPADQDFYSLYVVDAITGCVNDYVLGIESPADCDENDNCPAIAGEVSVNPERICFGFAPPPPELEVSTNSPGPVDDWNYFYFIVNEAGELVVFNTIVSNNFGPEILVKFTGEPSIPTFMLEQGEYCVYGISLEPTDEHSFEALNALNTFEEVQALTGCFEISDCAELTIGRPPEYDLTTPAYCNADSSFSIGVTVFGGSGLYNQEGLIEPFEAISGEEVILTFYDFSGDFLGLYVTDALTGCANDYVIPVNVPNCGNGGCPADAGEIMATPNAICFGFAPPPEEIYIDRTVISNGPVDDWNYFYFMVNKDGQLVPFDTLPILIPTFIKFTGSSSIPTYMLTQGEYCVYGISLEPIDEHSFEALNELTTFEEVQALTGCFEISDCAELTIGFPPEYDLTTPPICDLGLNTFTIGVTAYGGSGSYIASISGEEFEMEGDGVENRFTLPIGFSPFYNLYVSDAITGCGTDYIIPFEVDCDSVVGPCPTVLPIELDPIVLCGSEEVIDLTEGFPDADTWINTNTGQHVTNPQQVTVSAPECETATHTFSGFINGCWTAVQEVSLHPVMEAGITENLCGVSIFPNCDYFDVFWEDSEGNEGEGNTHEPLAGQSGTVTFVVVNPEVEANVDCRQRSFDAPFACGSIANPCEDTIEFEITTLPICNLADHTFTIGITVYGGSGVYAANISGAEFELEGNNRENVFTLPIGFSPFYEVYVLDSITGCRSLQTIPFELDCDSIGGPCPAIPAVFLDPIVECNKELEINLTELFPLATYWRNSTTGEVVANPESVVIEAPECETLAYVYEGLIGNNCVVAVQNVTLHPVIEAGITENLCGVSIFPNCDYFNVIWEDSEGNEGEGNTHEPLAGQSGTVTFVVINPEVETGSSCRQRSFDAPFDCGTDVCPESMDTTTAICTGDTLNIFDFIEPQVYPANVIVEPWTNVTTGEVIDNPEAVLLSAEDCQNTHYVLQQKAHDPNRGCTAIFTLEVNVWAVLTAETKAYACGVDLLVSCENVSGFLFTWEDSNGNEGNGKNYHADFGESGTVTFFIHKITDEIYPCAFPTALTDSFNCDVDCSLIDPYQPEGFELAACNGEAFELPSVGENNEPLTWYHDVQLTQPVAHSDSVVISNDFCEADQVHFYAPYTLNDPCVGIILYHAAVVVAAPIQAEIQQMDTGLGMCPAISVETACENIDYSFSWEDNLGNEGEGNIYFPQNGTNGIVTFLIEHSNAETCNTLSISANFACDDIPCDFPTFEFQQVGVCGDGQLIDLTELFAQGDLATWRDHNGNIIDEPNHVLLPVNEECEPVELFYEGAIIEDTASLCGIYYIVNITIFPVIEAALTEPTCGIAAFPNCPDFEVSWEDDLGNSGVGNTQIPPADGGEGILTFHIVNPDPLAAEFDCHNQSISVPFNCGEGVVCPDVAVIHEEHTTCDNAPTNLNEIAANSGFPVIAPWTNVESGEVVENPEELRLQADDCEPITATFITTVLLGEDSPCTTQFEVTITILPTYSGATTVDSCLVIFTPHCLEDTLLGTGIESNWFWEDNLGNTGDGWTYLAAEGTAGQVTFQFKDFEIDLLCLVNPATAFFNCNGIVDCPDVELVEDTLLVCAGEVFNLNKSLPGSDVLIPNPPNTIAVQPWINVTTGEVVANPEEVVLAADNCEVRTYQFTTAFASSPDVDCAIPFQLEVIVQPTISGTTTVNACIVTLTPTCIATEDGWVWEDNLGNTGEGTIYEAPANSLGVVTFHFAHPLIDPVCPPESVSASFNCNGVNCPVLESIETSAMACSGQPFNLYQSIPFGNPLDLFQQDWVNQETGEIVDNPEELVIEINGCEAETHVFATQMTAMPNTPCTVTLIVTLSVQPVVSGTTNVDGCTVTLTPNCIDTNEGWLWEDSFGNTGEGTVYEAADSVGEVTFHFAHPLILLACPPESVTAMFNCSLGATFDTPETNRPPIAVDDAMGTAGSRVVIRPMQNDSDPDGDNFTITTYSEPDHGTVQYNNRNQTFRYRPQEGFTGMDQFQYQICDLAGACDEATISITVDRAMCSDTLVVCTPAVVPNLICPDFCDLSPDSEYEIVSVHSIFSCSITDQSSDCFEYTALPSFAGTEVLDVIACETGTDNCDMVTVIIHVGNDCADLTDEDIIADSEINGINKTLDTKITHQLEESNDLVINQLYPVPAQTELYVNFVSMQQKVKLSVYDITGKEVMIQSVETIADQEKQATLFIGDLPSGLYILRAATDTQQVNQSFIVK